MTRSKEVLKGISVRGRSEVEVTALDYFNQSRDLRAKELGLINYSIPEHLAYLSRLHLSSKGQ